MASVVCVCGWCGTRFEPNIRQLGQKRRGHSLFCSPECCEANRKHKCAAWARTDEGRTYFRNRARLIATGKHTPKPRAKALKRRKPTKGAAK